MKLTPYWTDDYPRPSDLAVTANLPNETDVVVVGSGYTGLSAARTLAKRGVAVTVVESETIGWGASSRNAGITGCSLKQKTPTIFKWYGEEYGRKFWEISLDALELIKELVYEEGIECDWHQNGDMCVYYKPSHYEEDPEWKHWHADNLDHELELVAPADLRSVIGSDAYYGGVIDAHGADLHPAKLVFGMAEVAAKYGAFLCENTSVTRIEKQPNGYLVHTGRGRVQAKQVIVCTNGYTDGVVRGLRSRVIPVGSYSIVTEPLPDDLQREISPRGLTFWDSKWFLNYFRLTPDGRMLWGGRNNLSTTLDLVESAEILRKEMVQAFPQLSNVPITHSWTGQLGLTFDLMPHIGQIDGVYYALGFGGHGLHTAIYLGREVAQLITGEKASSPFAEIPHRKYFFYRNKPWFMPLAVMFYRIRDWLS
ncbi:MAG: FAD-binding oxidoreductase [Anaerolineales bacterium]|nr:FAD-binding oxidoreductase [Anaerolineales bacterium]